jgi:diguanylate cyclase (GGDEF)-like protein/PAS domain S-box-containing protein
MGAVRALSPLERRQSRSGNPGSKPTTRVITMSPAASLNDDFLFGSLMETMADSIYFKDRQGRLLRVSRKMARDLGYADPAELVGKTDADLFGQEFAQRTMLDDSRVMETDQPLIGLTESRQLESGQVNWTLTSKMPLHDAAGAVVGLLGITREINELKRAEIALQDIATHDSLTGLPNRYLMFDRLNQLLVRAERFATCFAVLFIDLDGFKRINDSRGHDVGDLVLRAVAERLSQSVRAADTVARIGGDEFVILLEALRAGGDATAVAQKIHGALEKPFALPGGAAKVTVSIGIGLYPQDGRDADVLLKAADIDMYRAKQKTAAPRPVGPNGEPDTRSG